MDNNLIKQHVKDFITANKQGTIRSECWGTVEDSTVLGIVLAKYFDNDPAQILETTATALEQGNFHDEARFARNRATEMEQEHNETGAQVVESIVTLLDDYQSGLIHDSMTPDRILELAQKLAHKAVDKLAGEAFLDLNGNY